MEQYLGQFVGIIVSSLQNEGLSSTIFSGFLILAGATILAYMAFRILLIAFKVGLVVAALAIVASIGMPALSQFNGTQKSKHPEKEIGNSPVQDSKFSMSNISNFISEDKLRAVFLSYIIGIKR